jgi:hypothetical protein
MRRMGGADAFMLAMETPRAYMHTFKVAILDPSTDPEGWSFSKFQQDFFGNTLAEIGLVTVWTHVGKWEYRTLR